MAGRNQRGRHVWTEADIKLLGTMTDADAAAQIGCTTAAAMLKRQTLKIKSFGRGTQKKPAASPEIARTERLQVRLSPEELSGLEEAAGKLGKTAVDLVRGLILAML